MTMNENNPFAGFTPAIVGEPLFGPTYNIMESKRRRRFWFPKIEFFIEGPQYRIGPFKTRALAAKYLDTKDDPQVKRRPF